MNNGNTGMVINEVNPPVGMQGPVQSGGVSSEEEKKKKGGGRVVVLLILLFLIVALGGVAFWYFNSKKVNPVKVYQNAINDLYGVLESGLKNVGNSTGNQIFKVNPFNEPFTLGIKANMETNIEELAPYSGYEYNFSGGVDYKNRKIALKGSLGKSGRELLDAFLLQTNGNLYLRSLKSFSKVLNLGKIDLFRELDLDDLKNEIEDNFGSSGATLDMQELEKVVGRVKDIILGSFDKNKFTVKDEEISVDGVKIKVKKVSYNLDKENQVRTLKYILERIADDEIIIKFLADNSGKDKNMISANIKQIASGIEVDNYSDADEGIISLYIDSKDKIVAGDLVTNNEKVLTFTNGKKLIFDFQGTQIVIDRQKDFDDVSIVSGGAEMIGLKSYKLDKEFKLEIRINVLNEFKGSAEVGIKNTNMTDSKISSEMSIKFDVIVDEENYKFEGNMGIDFEKGMLEAFDTKDSVGIEELSIDDVNLILDNLDKNLKGTPFEEMVVELKAMLKSSGAIGGENDGVNCAKAYDCVCDVDGGSTCNCKYLDESNNVKDIVCPAYVY